MKQPLRIVELSLGAVYITPLGHRCKLKPRKHNGDHYTFFYLSRRGEFSLTGENVFILRREL
jgi:hypothetical protein